MGHPDPDRPEDTRPPSIIWDAPMIFQAPHPGQGVNAFYNVFTPELIVHRGVEISTLTKYFEKRLREPTSDLNTAVIKGPGGTGKHLVVRALQTTLHQLTSSIPHIDTTTFRWITLNCRQYNTALGIFSGVLQHLRPEILLTLMREPNLFTQPQTHLLRVLRQQPFTVFLILDQYEFFAPSNQRFLFDQLTQMGNTIRTSVINQQRRSHINVVVVINKPTVETEVKPVLAPDQHHVELEPYSPTQRYDLLRAYARVGLQSTAYDKQVLQRVVDLSMYQADVRLAIDLLWRAATLAAADSGNRITEDYVIQAFEQEMALKLAPVLDLRLHQQLLLYSLAELLHNRTTTDRREVEARYELNCDEFALRPRRGTTLYDYLLDFEALNLITRVTFPGSLPATISMKAVPASEILQLFAPIIRELEEGL